MLEELPEPRDVPPKEMELPLPDELGRELELPDELPEFERVPHEERLGV